jgi:hypothetical protein
LREFDLLLVIDDYLRARLGKCEIQLKLDAEYDRDAIVRTLRRGGPEAVTLFLQVSIDLHDSGGMPSVNSWVKVALPALPGTERCALVGMLIEALVEIYDLEIHDKTTHLH